MLLTQSSRQLVSTFEYGSKKIKKTRSRMIIETPTRGSIFGSLDQSASMLERASHSLSVNLEGGQVRFRIEDVRRMKSYIRKIRPQLRKIEGAVKEFALIAKTQ